VPGLELANLALIVGHDFDREITNTHDDTPQCGTMKSTSTLGAERGADANQSSTSTTMVSIWRFLSG
jgi:hypothetical protein